MELGFIYLIMPFVIISHPIFHMTHLRHSFVEVSDQQGLLLKSLLVKLLVQIKVDMSHWNTLVYHYTNRPISMKIYWTFLSYSPTFGWFCLKKLS